MTDETPEGAAHAMLAAMTDAFNDTSPYGVAVSALRSYGERCRWAALEEAAKKLDSLIPEQWGRADRYEHEEELRNYARAIRALAGEAGREGK